MVQLTPGPVVWFDMGSEFGPIAAATQSVYNSKDQRLPTVSIPKAFIKSITRLSKRKALLSVRHSRADSDINHYSPHAQDYHVTVIHQHFDGILPTDDGQLSPAQAL